MPSDSPAKTVFLFDIDNTLLDNDRVTGDLEHFLENEVGSERAQRYWSIFDNLRCSLVPVALLLLLTIWAHSSSTVPNALTICAYSRWLVF